MNLEEFVELFNSHGERCELAIKKQESSLDSEELRRYWGKMSPRSILLDGPIGWTGSMFYTALHPIKSYKGVYYIIRYTKP